eukprot:28890-Lingulodinium_polyedra.AAC.1
MEHAHARGRLLVVPLAHGRRGGRGEELGGGGRSGCHASVAREGAGASAAAAVPAAEDVVERVEPGELGEV